MHRCPRHLAAIALLGLAVQLGGCAGSTSVGSLPGGGPVSAPPRAQAEEVAVGDEVRATLHDGRLITGEVLALSGAEIVVGADTQFGYQEHVLAAAEIARLEVVHPPAKAKVVVGAVFGLAAALLVALALTMDSVTGWN